MSDDRMRSRRRLLIAGAVIGVLIVLIACTGFFAYRMYVPQSFTASQGQLDKLSPSDREIVSESTRLGQQAGTLGTKLGQASLFGDSEGAAKYGAELNVIGQRLLELSAKASNPQLKLGLSQAGRGATMTAEGVETSTPSKVDQGIKLVKQAQETLRSV